MDDKDLVFHLRNKIYIANMIDWINTDRHVNVTREEIMEHKFTKREVEKDKEAGEMVRSAGFPSRQEAVHLASDGNIAGIPLTAQDVHRYYEIYGPPIEAICAKTTEQKPKKVNKFELDYKCEKTHQEFTSDVTYAMK